MRRLHNRMPVIIAPADIDRWLDPTSEAAALLRPAADDLLAMHPVSTRVNSPKVDDASLIQPVEGAEPETPKPSQQGLFD